VIYALVHVLTALLLPPLMLGVIQRIKAAVAGRKGPPLLQPWFDVWKLLRKQMVVSSTTGPVFLLGPAVGLATALAAALLVPLGHDRPPVSFAGDFVLFAYLLALGRFFTAAAALDTGSSFEGMGASREVTFAWLVEPTVFLVFLALAQMSGSLTLAGMLNTDLLASSPVASGALVLILAAWFVVLLVENCRIPFDDPATHLELTMIHEVMVLDHSGPALAAILYGAAVKLFVLGAVFVGLLLPYSTGPEVDWLLFVAAMLLLAVLVGLVESVMARLRLVSVPKLLVSAGLLAAFAVVFLEA
jgi:formate hydrogenlyase subunit 4